MLAWLLQMLKYQIAAMLQLNLSVTTTSIIKFIAGDLFSNMFN